MNESIAGHLVDLDGNDYVDFTLAMGPIVIGHREPAIIEHVRGQLDHTVLHAAESPELLELTERLHEWIPCADRMIFSSSGTEAVQNALRLARATTGRRRILKFEGQYHGWMDPVFSNAPGTEPQPACQYDLSVVPDSFGQAPADDAIMVTHWNDIAAFDALIERHGDELAAVLMEPIPFNFGTYLATPGYLEHVREVCTARGILLIFDEVVSGFRVGRGGAQALLGVTPDMATFAKGLGGGFTVAMVAGTDRAFAAASDGRYHTHGTYNSNPLGIAGANATTRLIDNLPDLYHRLNVIGSELHAIIEQTASDLDVPLQVNRFGSVLQLFWNTEGDRRSYRSCSSGDTATVKAICTAMAKYGIYTPVRGLIFTCYRHTEEDLQRFGAALHAAIRDIVQ
jgi:glutamate-1-semialdehyde 2,1-aminomutase